MQTFDSNLTRTQLIMASYRKIGALRGSVISTEQLTRGIEALNLIIREEDLKGTGLEKNLWALKTATVQLQAGGYVYTPDDGLASDIREIETAYYRDTSGDDVSVYIITKEQYEALDDKDETGDVEKIYLQINKNLSCQKLHIWPAPTSVGTTSEVIGSDGENYRCIMGHTSATINKPVTGSSYRLFWEEGGTSGTTWVTATAYTNGELIRYAYKRPLYDMGAGENPDMPAGWTRYLMFRLAYDMSFDHGILLDERKALEYEYMKARAEIFPSTKQVMTNFHNKATFF